MDLSQRRISLFNLPIHDVSSDEAVGVILQFLDEGSIGRFVVTTNAHHVVVLRRDPDLRRVYQRADLGLADGMSVVWASCLLRRPLRARVAGSDLFPRLCAAAAERGDRVFLLGAAPGVADRAAARLRRRHPGLHVVGTYAPPSGFERHPSENEAIVRMIQEQTPDLLFVALGFPKQERWIAQHAEACGVSVAMGVGAAFDFVAGVRRRAPNWMQRAGLEWLYRLMQEPGRLAYRYGVLGLQFIALTAVEWWRTRRAPTDPQDDPQGRS
ncbi:MAG: WecB/TagA/CpsF family glycosyltransferase [Salinibacter sp.]